MGSFFVFFCVVLFGFKDYLRSFKVILGQFKAYVYLLFEVCAISSRSVLTANWASKRKRWCLCEVDGPYLLPLRRDIVPSCMPYVECLFMTFFCFLCGSNRFLGHFKVNLRSWDLLGCSLFSDTSHSLRSSTLCASLFRAWGRDSHCWVHAGVQSDCSTQ